METDIWVHFAKRHLGKVRFIIGNSLGKLHRLVTSAEPIKNIGHFLNKFIIIGSITAAKSHVMSSNDYNLQIECAKNRFEAEFGGYIREIIQICQLIIQLVSFESLWYMFKCSNSCYYQM